MKLTHKININVCHDKKIKQVRYNTLHDENKQNSSIGDSHCVNVMTTLKAN